MARCWILSFQVSGVGGIQTSTSATMRPSAWPSRPPVPSARRTRCATGPTSATACPFQGPDPSGSAARGPVDAQHLGLGQRRFDALMGNGPEGVRHGRPRRTQIAGGLDDRGADIPAYDVRQPALAEWEITGLDGGGAFHPGRDDLTGGPSPGRGSAVARWARRQPSSHRSTRMTDTPSRSSSNVVSFAKPVAPQ